MQDPFAKPDDSVTYGPQHGIGGMFSTPAGPAGIVAQSPYAHTQPQGTPNSLSTAQPNFYSPLHQQAQLHSPMPGGHPRAGYAPTTGNVALTQGSPYAASFGNANLQHASTTMMHSPTWQPSPMFHGGVGDIVSSPHHGVHAASTVPPGSIVDPLGQRAQNDAVAAQHAQWQSQ